MHRFYPFSVMQASFVKRFRADFNERQNKEVVRSANVHFSYLDGDRDWIHHPAYPCKHITHHILANTSPSISLQTHHPAYPCKYITQHILANTSPSISLQTHHSAYACNHITQDILANTSPSVSLQTHHPAYPCIHVFTRYWCTYFFFQILFLAFSI